jgi:hypothetical protein
MSNFKKSFVTCVGRLVGGSLTKPKTKDSKGNQMVVKTGANKGKETQKYDFAVAFPKNGLAHWNQLSAQTPKGVDYFGKTIFDVANTAFPGGITNRPDFAWKITDGDSTVPNKRQNRPCDQEGYPGHWVFWFSTAYAPKCFDAKGTTEIPNDAIKLGHYVQVMGEVDTNEQTDNPGIYLNHRYVAHSGFGPEITVGPDASDVGFGAGPLPSGASSTPVASMSAPAAPVAPAPAPPASTTAVQPNAGFVNVAPPPPAAPAPPAPPAPPAGPQMTAKANGTSYDQFRASGWTDDALRAHGYMV